MRRPAQYGRPPMKLMGRAVDEEGAVPSPPIEGHHAPWSRRVRSLVFGPQGGGTTRRRASDVVRLATAVALIVVLVPLADANTSVEIHVTELLTPPPTGIHWLISALWFLGSVGVIVALVLLGLLVPRLTAVRQMALAVVVTILVCLCSTHCWVPTPVESPWPRCPASIRTSPCSNSPSRPPSHSPGCRI